MKSVFFSSPTRAHGYALSHATKSSPDVPESTEIDPEVVEFRAHFDGRSPLDELVRVGARQMLQSAIEQEAAVYTQSPEFDPEPPGVPFAGLRICRTDETQN